MQGIGGPFLANVSRLIWGGLAAGISIVPRVLTSFLAPRQGEFLDVGDGSRLQWEPLLQRYVAVFDGTGFGSGRLWFPVGDEWAVTAAITRSDASVEMAILDTSLHTSTTRSGAVLINLEDGTNGWRVIVGRGDGTFEALPFGNVPALNEEQIVTFRFIGNDVTLFVNRIETTTLTLISAFPQFFVDSTYFGGAGRNWRGTVYCLILSDFIDISGSNTRVHSFTATSGQIEEDRRELGGRSIYDFSPDAYVRIPTVIVPAGNHIIFSFLARTFPLISKTFLHGPTNDTSSSAVFFINNSNRFFFGNAVNATATLDGIAIVHNVTQFPTDGLAHIIVYTPTVDQSIGWIAANFIGRGNSDFPIYDVFIGSVISRFYRGDTGPTWVDSLGDGSTDGTIQNYNASQFIDNFRANDITLDSSVIRQVIGALPPPMPTPDRYVAVFDGTGFGTGRTWVPMKADWEVSATLSRSDDTVDIAIIDTNLHTSDDIAGAVLIYLESGAGGWHFVVGRGGERFRDLTFGNAPLVNEVQSVIFRVSGNEVTFLVNDVEINRLTGSFPPPFIEGLLFGGAGRNWRGTVYSLTFSDLINSIGNTRRYLFDAASGLIEQDINENGGRRVYNFAEISWLTLSRIQLDLGDTIMIHFTAPLNRDIRTRIFSGQSNNSSNSVTVFVNSSGRYNALHLNGSLVFVDGIRVNTDDLFPNDGLNHTMVYKVDDLQTLQRISSSSNITQHASYPIFDIFIDAPLRRFYRGNTGPIWDDEFSSPIELLDFNSLSTQGPWVVDANGITKSTIEDTFFNFQVRLEVGRRYSITYTKSGHTGADISFEIGTAGFIDSGISVSEPDGTYTVTGVGTNSANLRMLGKNALLNISSVSITEVTYAQVENFNEGQFIDDFRANDITLSPSVTRELISG